MPVMEGTITLVQESRFQVTDDAGSAHLFLLGAHAAAEPAALAPLAARQARLCVDYQDGETMIGAVAREVFVVDTPDQRP